MPITKLHLPSDAQQQLITNELGRFGALPKALNLEQLDGYFTALHLSPVDYDISDWLELVWGGGDLPVGGLFFNSAEIEQFFSIIIGHWQNIAARLANDELFVPLAFIKRPDASFWAQGFLLGTQLYRQQWQEFSLAQGQEFETVLLTQAYWHRDDHQSHNTANAATDTIVNLNQQMIVLLNQFVRGSFTG